ncbi:hypothetical protein GW17_00029732 [Ensete ventricosum]|nr:hypothetical protein GW17_00029732 [Ensete ventricosum]
MPTAEASHFGNNDRGSKAHHNANTIHSQFCHEVLLALTSSAKKRARSLSSIRVSRASNLASISSSDAMGYGSRSKILQSFFCCRVKGMDRLDRLMDERDKDQRLYRGYNGNSLRLERWLRVVVDDNNEFVFVLIYATHMMHPLRFPNIGIRAKQTQRRRGWVASHSQASCRGGQLWPRPPAKGRLAAATTPPTGSGRLRLAGRGGRRLQGGTHKGRPPAASPQVVA